MIKSSDKSKSNHKVGACNGHVVFTCGMGTAPPSGLYMVYTISLSGPLLGHDRLIILIKIYKMN